MTYSIMREIGIDMGHRVTTHGSKCKNVHGHRYTIIANCRAEELHESGEQSDMVLDFGFLKDEMMKQIDQNFDHGFTLWIDDPLIRKFIEPTGEEWIELFKRIKVRIASSGHCLLEEPTSIIGKLIIVPFIPTAEKLAEHWFNLLEPRVHERSEGLARLSGIKVWETPNCSAVYRPQRKLYQDGD